MQAAINTLTGIIYSSNFQYDLTIDTRMSKLEGGMGKINSFIGHIPFLLLVLARRCVFLGRTMDGQKGCLIEPLDVILVFDVHW